jgi:hypothetical protein
MWPVATSAQVAELPQISSTVQTVEQVRQAFSYAGFTVDAAHTWDWTSPSFTSFQVHDSASDRVLMVLVYPSGVAAEAARLQAASHEQSSHASPHLVIGYGLSSWNGNVALVETTGSELNRLYQAELDRDNDLYITPDIAQPVVSQSDVAVDIDFQQALENGAVNL